MPGDAHGDQVEIEYTYLADDRHHRAVARAVTLRSGATFILEWPMSATGPDQLNIAWEAREPARTEVTDSLAPV